MEFEMTVKKSSLAKGMKMNKKLKKKNKKQKQIADKRREMKGKREKERYIHWMESSKEYQGEIRKPS